MKKKLILLLLISININYFCYAQPDDANVTKVESVEMAYITKELALTEGEAERLWPVYNNYKNEIRSAKGETGDDQIKLAEAVLNIRKKYKNEFKKILGSDQRVNKLFVAEKGFMKILQNELRNRQGK